MPIFLPLVLVGTTLATIVASATIPQSVNEPTKQELVVRTKNAISNDDSKLITKFIFSEFIKDHLALILIALLILGVLILR